MKQELCSMRGASHPRKRDLRATLRHAARGRDVLFLESAVALVPDVDGQHVVRPEPGQVSHARGLITAWVPPQDHRVDSMIPRVCGMVVKNEIDDSVMV